MAKRIIWHCAFPLFLGFLIYLFFHAPNLRLHQWLAEHYAFPNFYKQIKDQPIAIFLLNHVPDALWDYSLSYFLILCFSNLLKKNIRAALIVFIVSSTEIVQLFFPKQFTFDWTDLLLSILISVLVLSYSRYEKKTIT